MNPPLHRDLSILAVLVLAAIGLSFVVSDFALSIVLSCLMYIALATSWSVFCGTTGYLSLASAAFFGIGAYTSAFVLDAVPWLVAIGLGALAAVVLAIVMGSAVLHLRGTYFAVLTFGMTELIRHTVTLAEKSLAGTVGRVLIDVPEPDTVYFTMLAIAAAAVLTTILVRRSRLGLAMTGIGGDEQRAETLGVNARYVKVAGFTLTAVFAGAAGAAMSVRWTYIDPATVFNPFIGFQTVLIALIGGAASLWGPVAAAIVFSLLAETLRLQLPQVYMMALGLLLILSVLYMPDGLASLTGRLFGSRRTRSQTLPDAAEDQTVSAALIDPPSALAVGVAGQRPDHDIAAGGIGDDPSISSARPATAGLPAGTTPDGDRP